MLAIYSRYGVPRMPVIYRLVDARGELRDDAGSLADLNRLAASLGPGRYVVDEIRSEAAPAGHTSRRWGVIIRLADGIVMEEPDPWQG